MFLEKMVERNPELVETGLRLLGEGAILPDTYVIDVDRFLANAKAILDEADEQGIALYFMLKQIGRNPWLAKKLVELGYPGAVAVDFREAKILMDHGVPICNVGHLVQIPRGFLKDIVAYEPTYMTVFTMEKIREIDAEAARQGKTQKLLLKVVGPDDMLYSGQHAGFELDALDEVVEQIQTLDHVRIGGVTSFPCFLVDEQTGEANPTPNLDTLLAARVVLERHGVETINVNAPSATCVGTLKAMGAYPDITSAEPGHGLSGTTPLHARRNEPEVPCVVYMSEVSHNFRGHAYCFGGGHYRRSHVKHALVGTDLANAIVADVIAPELPCIDYYFELGQEFPVSAPVCMAFRFQIFVTRSHVALVEGLAGGTPRLAGLFDSQGRSQTWEDLS